MLAANKYPKTYIDACRAQIAAQLRAYDKVISTAKQAGATDGAFTAAQADFEPKYFNSLVVVLDMFFCHRTRTLEGKDGKPCNEVRVLSNSIMTNAAALLVDKTIKLKPESSVLGHDAGDAIGLAQADFKRLAAAYFTEIEKKFM